MCGIVAERGRNDLPPLISIGRNLFNPVARVISRGPQAHPAGADGGEMSRHTLGDGVGIHRPQLTADCPHHGGSERGIFIPHPDRQRLEYARAPWGRCAHHRATILERLAERLQYTKRAQSRVDYDAAGRFTSTFVLCPGRTEHDTAWSALCLVQWQLAEAGFSPR
jgi:hypothetical protein